MRATHLATECGLSRKIGGNLSQTRIFWVAIVCVPIGCATGFEPVDDTPPPTPKKDAATVDTGHDTGSMQQQDSGVQEDSSMEQDTGKMTCSRTIEYGTAMCDTCMENSCCK